MLHLLARSALPTGSLFAGARAVSASSVHFDQFYHLSYKYVEDILEKRVPHRAGHLAHAQAHIEKGQLLMGGAFADAGGACIVFRCADASVVDQFVKDDPYVHAGLVVDHSVREWNVVVGADSIVGE